MKYEAGKYYHLFNRGANKAKIFYSAENYRFLIELVKKNLDRYRVSLCAYCLMPNHYHFLMRQNEGGSISRFIQTTFNSYTQALNKFTGRSGTLFQGRVKGKEIDTDEYAVQVSRYIHCNPASAKLVSDPGDWRYSSFADWIGTRATQFLDLSVRDRYFSNGAEYREYVNDFVSVQKPKDFSFGD